ncbi:MAG TPA: hypothetical protein VK548_28110 [Candidatus Acidoferrum sp.]|nr:hypothetical protein [Candidatus Acidoferrum sp.]
MRRVFLNVGVLFAAVAISLVLAEGAARLVLNPADFLSVTTVRDDVLGIRVAPGTAGFDEWGFRNPRVPGAADIVAIGDSHTYGNNATMSQSWPYVAGRMTGKSVYSLALGGYGPNQYFQLLKTRALTLHPRWVVCGLYMGDDFENAFLMSYGKDYWAGLRSERRSAVDADIWKDTDDSCAISPECARRWHRRLRVWLSQHSLVYRLVVHGPVLGRLKGAVQVRRMADGGDGRTASLRVADAGIREAFRPVGIRARLDQHSAAVQEGMRITFELLGMMAKACHENGCQLLVAIIPTKETVFAEYVMRSPDMHLRDVIVDVVKHEGDAKARLIEFLERAGIAYVDTLPALRRKVTDHLYTRSDGDMHPSENGYRIIGEVVGDFIARDHRAASEREIRSATAR